MYKKRFFSGEFIPKVDALINYLRKNRLAFTFHAEMKLNELTGKSEPLYTVAWFEAANG